MAFLSFNIEFCASLIEPQPKLIHSFFLSSSYAPRPTNIIVTNSYIDRFGYVTYRAAQDGVYIIPGKSLVAKPVSVAGNL